MASRCAREGATRAWGGRPFEDGKSGFEEDGGRRVRRGKQGSQRFERRAGEVAKLVGERTGELLGGLFDSDAEVVRGLQSVVDGSAMNAGVGGGPGHGSTLSERSGDLDLSGRQLLDRERCRKCRIL